MFGFPVLRAFAPFPSLTSHSAFHQSWFANSGLVICAAHYGFFIILYQSHIRTSQTLINHQVYQQPAHTSNMGTFLVLAMSLPTEKFCYRQIAQIITRLMDLFFYCCNTVYDNVLRQSPMQRDR